MNYNIYLPQPDTPLPNITSGAIVPLFYQGGEQRGHFTAAVVDCGLAWEPCSISRLLITIDLIDYRHVCITTAAGVAKFGFYGRDRDFM